MQAFNSTSVSTRKVYGGGVNRPAVIVGGSVPWK